MIEDIMYTFDKNFLRLSNLINLYKNISSGRGRKPTNSLDILRATTVLAHSTLEDYLRSLMHWKLPLQDKEKISHISLIGTSEAGRATKFTLGDLAAHREKNVGDLIKHSIKQYLGTVSFNDTSDIASSLEKISIDTTEEMRRLFPTLNEMIKRRHNIVHNADRDIIAGSGNHKIKSIGVKQVETWKKTIDKFVVELNKNFIE